MRTRCIIIFFVIFGCKRNAEKEVYIKEQENFRIQIESTIPKDDSFFLYYLDEEVKGKPKFTEEKKLTEKVLGAEAFQKVSFKFPENTYPHQFRIDLGTNKDQEVIVIRSIKLHYKGQIISIENDVLDIFFIINKFIDLNAADGKLRFKKIANRKKPFIIAKPILLKKMELEF